MVGDHHDGGLLLLVHHDLADPRRGQRLGDERPGVFRPGDDVDLLAPQLVDHGPDTGPLRADARTHGIDVHVLGRDRDLRAVPRLARDGPDLDEPVLDLGDLLLEELADQTRMGAGDHDRGSLHRPADLDDVRTDAVADLVALAGNLLPLGHQRLRLAQRQDHVPRVVLLHDARDDVALTALVLLEGHLALGLTQALVDHLLGRLGRDPAELRGRLHEGFGEHLLGLLVDLLLEHTDLARLAIDLDARVLRGDPWRLRVGRTEGVLERLEEGLGGHATIPLERRQCVDQLEVAVLVLPLARHRLKPPERSVSPARSPRRPHGRCPPRRAAPPPTPPPHPRWCPPGAPDHP